MHTIFAEGHKNGKLLAMLVVNHHPKAHIPAIKDKGGTLVTDPSLIMQEFIDFFSTLYSAIPKYDTEALDLLLTNLPIPRLSEEACTVLDAKITIKEVQEAIFAFPPNKAPGPDGFPADFYKSHVDQLATRFNWLLEHCIENSSRGAWPTGEREGRAPEELRLAGCCPQPSGGF